MGVGKVGRGMGMSLSRVEESEVQIVTKRENKRVRERALGRAHCGDSAVGECRKQSVAQRSQCTIRWGCNEQGTDDVAMTLTLALALALTMATATARTEVLGCRFTLLLYPKGMLLKRAYSKTLKWNNMLRNLI